MKILDKITFLIFYSLFILLLSSCEKTITDFGNDCTLSGKLKDQSGNIVAGDITSANLLVKALGEGDVVSTDLRVKGDGTFQNTKLFPKKYRIFVTGPITPVDDTLSVDFSTDRITIKDIIVIPFLTVKKPAAVGNPTATTLEVSYEIIANSGKVVSISELYCSTSPYPNASTGSGPFYTTKKVTLVSNSGNASVTGLVTKTKYYIRIGAKATGATGFNYSEQIEITTL